MAGRSSSSNHFGRSNGNVGDNENGEHLHIDLNVNLSEESYWSGSSEPILRREIGGGSSASMSDYIDLNDAGPRIVPAHEIGEGWPRRRRNSETVGAPPVMDNSAANFPHFSSFRSIAAMTGGDGYDGTAGPSSGGHDQPHLLKRERPEDAAGVGIRMGASSDQRNVRQRFSSENQPNLSPAENSNHVQPPSESPHFALQLQSSPSYPTPNMEEAGSSRAAIRLPEFHQLSPDDDDDDARPLRVLYPSGPERVDMGQNQTYLYPGFGFNGSNNASSSASPGLYERFHTQGVPPSPIAGPSGLRYGGETSSSSSSNQFGRNAGPVQGGGFLGTPPIFGLNRRGEPLTGAALVRRSSTIPALEAGLAPPNDVHSALARYLGHTLMANSHSLQASSSTAPPRLAAAMPITESVSDWLPTYLPALQPEPSNWLPPYLAAANQVDNNFTPITWDDFEEEEDEEEEEEEDEEDMAYDVGNMSYEELLALEDQMGNVDTGLSEEIIMDKLKPKKYSCFKVGLPGDDEICCICQEGYEEGATILKLSCRHEFHFDCIKEWLRRKNLCPMCKKTALVI